MQWILPGGTKAVVEIPDDEDAVAPVVLNIDEEVFAANNFFFLLLLLILPLRFRNFGDIRNPERISRLSPGKRLWFRGLQRLRTQIRVVSAFRGAYERNTLQSRAHLMASYSRKLPVSHTAITTTYLLNSLQAIRAPTPDSSIIVRAPKELWRQTLNRLRFQIRVSNAFRAGIVARRMHLEQSGGFNPIGKRSTSPRVASDPPQAPIAPPPAQSTKKLSFAEVVLHAQAANSSDEHKRQEQVVAPVQRYEAIRLAPSTNVHFVGFVRVSGLVSIYQRTVAELWKSTRFKPHTARAQ